MPEKQILNVSRGLWIDKQLLKKAGLGSRLQLELVAGEIRIHSIPKNKRNDLPTKKGWQVFASLGDNAAKGCLENASENHDRYLYGKHL